jgi:hypothetical protein
MAISCFRALACAAVLGCATKSAAPPSDAPDAAPDAEAEAGGPLVFTMGAHVPAGADTYGCRYITLPHDDALYFVGASHTYSAGNHHLLVFRTDLDAAPSDAERDCFAPDDVMPHARAQVYGAQARTGTFALPSGVGLPLRSGEVLLMQAHYLNATASDVDATISLTVTTAKVGITQRAGSFFFDDPFVDAPPAQKSHAQIRCTVPSDATVVAVSAYAHARAIDFAAFLDPPAGPLGAAPFYRAPGFANPLPLQTSLAVPAGAHLRAACTYDNTKGTSELFAGPRNDADEACILSGIYFPDLGDDVSACRTVPDMFGTGSATCGATRTCVDACPLSATPPLDLGLGQARTIDPCWQKCVVASCADASAFLFALRACTSAKCTTECGQGPSAACTSCASAQCAKEVAACDADSCP